jgi:predicted MFS family arabinose efflux permease
MNRETAPMSGSTESSSAAAYAKAHRTLKNGYFVLEGLNSFATVYYLYYLYFYTQRVFGFSNRSNLLLAALSGLVYTCSAWYGGRFAQARGYFTALKLGFVIMIGSLCAGFIVTTAISQVLVMVFFTLGMCFTWPTLEALTSEGEGPETLPRMVGLYNLVWAGAGALAYFLGGAILDKMGPRSIFVVPALIQAAQLTITLWLERKSGEIPPQAVAGNVPAAAQIATVPDLPNVFGKTFRHMAWLTNPLAYVTINTLVAVMPGVAQRLGLSASMAGVYCSLWCFARFGAFWGLFAWTGWHYRFSWLLAAYLAMVAGFVLILTVPWLLVIIVAQIAFGAALGLVYYSSLFYSMDTSETKGTHGGIHEAIIGFGNFLGPAIGAGSLYYFPGQSYSGIIAVGIFLASGLAALGWIWRGRNP